MRSFILLLLITCLGAVEIENLPKEVTIDPKEMFGGKEYELFDTGYVTVRMQKYGYLDAKTVVADGKFKATPGPRYRIFELAFKDGATERFPCDIPITPDNLKLLERMFEQEWEWDRTVDLEQKTVRYLFRPKK